MRKMQEEAAKQGRFFISYQPSSTEHSVKSQWLLGLISIYIKRNDLYLSRHIYSSRHYKFKNDLQAYINLMMIFFYNFVSHC